MATSTYQYTLDRSSRKFSCPQCGKKRFVRVVDNETGDFLPDHVGRCDREHGCGYELKWSEWKKETGSVTAKPAYFEKRKPEPVQTPQPVDFLPMSFLKAALRSYKHNNFFSFLTTLFGNTIAVQLCKEYLIGTSRHWKGAAVFPQIDEKGNLRQVKIMLHHPATGKRVKEGATVEQYNRHTGTYDTIITERPCSLIWGKYLSETTKELNLQQVFFGQHLLAEYPDKEVCITESEKTAIIASVYLPQFVWLATGGASGCKWREYETYKALRGRTVTFFPDHGIFNRKTGKTCYQEWCERVERIREAIGGRIRVSDLLEKRLADTERQDQDLADLLLQRDQSAGLALTEAGYPVMWDYTIKNFDNDK